MDLYLLRHDEISAACLRPNRPAASISWRTSRTPVPGEPAVRQFPENQPYASWTDLAGPAEPHGDVGDAVEGLADYIARRAPSPCFVDVTTPDVRTLELEVVRVIAPGLASPHWGPRSQALINARTGVHHVGNTDLHPLV